MGGLPGLWSSAGVPKKGWRCTDVEDHEEPEATCEMCGRDDLRYVHIMVHADFDRDVEAGCVCASKMEEDYRAAKSRESSLKKWEKRRARWMATQWRTSAKGNRFLKARGTLYVAVPSRYRTGQWIASIGGKFLPGDYPSLEAVKSDIFEAIDPRPYRTRKIAEVRT